MAGISAAQVHAWVETLKRAGGEMCMGHFSSEHQGIKQKVIKEASEGIAAISQVGKNKRMLRLTEDYEAK